MDRNNLENTSLIEDQETILEHYVNEWTMLNQYINAIDLGFEKILTIIIMVCGGTLTLVTLIYENITPILGNVFFVVPLIFMAIFCYLGYQFRIVAILRGHAARIEEEMNKILGKDIYLWNSALVETYMAHNNIPNQWMIIPISLVVFITSVICILFTLSIWHVHICILYWGFIFIFSLIIFSQFLSNEKIRHKTYRTEDVMKLYYKYRENNLQCDKDEKNQTCINTVRGYDETETERVGGMR